MKTRPKKPKPRPHNPDKLTLDQVNPPVYKYRLLDRDEIKERSGVYIEIEQFLDGEWNSSGWSGTDRCATYRTTLTRAELAKLK